MRVTAAKLINLTQRLGSKRIGLSTDTERNEHFVAM